MELLSLVLTLRPMQPADPAKPLPLWWGRAAHALLLNVVRQYNPPLAESLHDPALPNADFRSPTEDSPSKVENPIRPFTVSTLIGRFPQGGLDGERPYTLRITAFSQQVADVLSAATLSGPLAPGATIELDYLPFRVESVQPAASLRSEIQNPKSEIENPWAAATSYQELSAPYLLAKIPAPRRVSLQFTSPTTFKSGGKHVPIPMPELVFGSLLERWNAYAPIAFPPETRRYAEECLAVSYFKLSSRRAPTKSGGLRMGGVGEITYTSLNYDRYWMSVIGTLAAFSLFSGVGAGTAHGLGQCRMTNDDCRF